MPETGNNSIDKSLSIRFATDGFSYCADGECKSFNFTKHDAGFSHCMAVCLCEPIIWEPYSTVNIEVDDWACSIIPSSVFREKDCPAIIKFNHPDLNLRQYTIRPDTIEGFDITNIYTIDNELYKFIQENFPYATVSHLSTALITDALKHSKKSDDSEVWCYWTNTHIFLSVVSRGQLLLANRFSISGQTDATYYIGAIFNQYNLSQSQTSLFIKGECPCIKEVRRYVSNVITTE